MRHDEQVQLIDQLCARLDAGTTVHAGRVPAAAHVGLHFHDTCAQRLGLERAPLLDADEVVATMKAI